ncbi:MAG: RNA-binding protein [Candidatus Abyssobacteria bacterium SURF_5]|uniref:RNA-binding protein n=1 Tax=Abyssobacteria bacterium (strain SURF_5) TaxID=2093360 RepID=A0A3A4NPQ6_ABYX5|nr:MAG: RNA-binding protein [Candidatus Abyssubacteria bacterium SURF_5]
MNIYVGNLARGVTENDLREAFAAFGQVASAKIITDKFSGESRGFGFVEMPADAEAREAINGLNGKDLKGQTLNVNEARPRPEGRREGGGPRGGGPRGGGYRPGGPGGARRGGGGRPR